MFSKVKRGDQLLELIDPLVPFVVGCSNIMPVIWLLPRKLGGQIQKVPASITEKKQVLCVMKWIWATWKKNTRGNTIGGLSNIVVDSVYNKGEVIEKKFGFYEIGVQNRHLIRKGPKWRRGFKFIRRKLQRKLRWSNKRKLKFDRFKKLIPMGSLITKFLKRKKNGKYIFLNEWQYNNEVAYHTAKEQREARKKSLQESSLKKVREEKKNLNDNNYVK